MKQKLNHLYRRVPDASIALGIRVHGDIDDGQIYSNIRSVSSSQAMWTLTHVRARFPSLPIHTRQHHGQCLEYHVSVAQ